MREVVEVLLLPRVRHHPRIAGHVRDRVVAGDELAIGESLVQDAIEPSGLLHVAIHRIGDALRRVLDEVMILTGHGSEPGHLPHEPLEHVDPGARLLREEAPRLRGEVDQDRAGFEDGDRPAAVTRIGVDDGGNAIVRRDGQELGLELLAAADVDRLHPVGQRRLFQEDGDLVAVRRGPVVEVDHWGARGTREVDADRV